MDSKFAEAYEQLKKIRQSTTVKIKLPKFVRESITTLDGTEVPFTLRYYQVQGVVHLIKLNRMVLGDDVGLGKTIETIVALCHILEKNPDHKVVIVAPKSLVHQWAAEILRFTTGITPLPVTSPKSTKIKPLDHRKAIYQQWLDTPLSVLILNYSILIRDWNAEGVTPVKPNGRPDPKRPVIPGVLDGVTLAAGKRVVVGDEAQAFKSPKTKTWEAFDALSRKSQRAYALTATLLKSNLLEGYGIFKAVRPSLFGTKTKFIEDYCITKMQSVPGRNRQVPIVVGYRNIQKFRETIDPFFLGRKKQDVSTELPTLISKDIICELSQAEHRKYAEALQGVIELGDGIIRDYAEHKALVALIYCQQVVDSLSLLKFEEGAEIGDAFLDPETLDLKTIKVGALGAKEEALIELLTEGDLVGEKVLVYTRFASLVPRLQALLDQHKIPHARITGRENEKARQAAQEGFQIGSTQVVFITDAGGVGINLQMAKAMIFYDLPWTWGDYVQTLGRMVRIGSPHKGVMVYHLMAERPVEHGSRKTIDHHVHALLRKKKALIDQVLGEAAVGALSDEVKDEGRSIQELLKIMQSDVV